MQTEREMSSMRLVLRSPRFRKDEKAALSQMRLNGNENKNTTTGAR